MSDEKEDDPWAEALAEQASSKSDESADQSEDPDNEAEESAASAQSAEPAAFEDFSDDEHKLDTLGESDRNLDLILDVPVTVSMEVGRTQVPIRTLLQLSQGSVVELDRLAGEPLDVLVNGTLIAHGEVVVVNEKFGIRLTDVISPAERVRKLR